MKRFAFINTWKKAYPIERLCKVLSVTSRGFRAWCTRPISRRQREDMVLLAHIREQFTISRKTYGRPRMVDELRDMGFTVGHRRVGRLMRDNDIKAVRTRKYKPTTNSKHGYAIAPNLLDRDFTATQPNQKWAVDISYIWTSEGWLYLAVVMDLHSRRIIGWAVSNRMKRDLAIKALQMAITLRKPPKGCIHHSDRGSQYCSRDYQKLLKTHSFQVSMSGKGNCYDNAVVETFFKTLKAELVWRNTWQTRKRLHQALFRYINGFYNPKRRHSTLGGLSPMAFERQAA